LVLQEMKLREERTMNACVLTANFPYLKTEMDFDFDFQPSINKLQIRNLLTLNFLTNNENVIFVGTPGTGKTHLAVALGIKAARARNSTYFITFQELIAQLKEANYQKRLQKRLKHFAGYKLLIIDELGYLEMDDEAANLFFQLTAMRYEKKSNNHNNELNILKMAGDLQKPGVDKCSIRPAAPSQHSHNNKRTFISS